jgi:uncharacterized phage protein gp47/JayE
MAWTTPQLRTVREMVRNDCKAAVAGSVMIANSVLRIMADAMAGLAHLTLRYLDWLALQLLPDTASTEWLDRHGDIWLTNADNSVGRKSPAYADGLVNFSGLAGSIIPAGAELTAEGVNYEIVDQLVLGLASTTGHVRSLDPGAASNLDPDTDIAFVVPIAGVDTAGTVVTMTGGTDQETDPQLRARVLERIRNPPMGGSAEDYVNWTLRVDGVTRVWVAPNEMGMGTVTIRFMMDDLRADGIPLTQDIAAVTSYLDTVRPVAIKDRFVEAPIPEPIDFTIKDLNPNTTTVKGAISASVDEMLRLKARPSYSVDGVRYPAQTIYAAWVSDAIIQAPGVVSFTLIMTDHVMPNNGNIGVLGNISYA